MESENYQSPYHNKGRGIDRSHRIIVMRRVI